MSTAVKMLRFVQSSAVSCQRAQMLTMVLTHAWLRAEYVDTPHTATAQQRPAPRNLGQSSVETKKFLKYQY